MRRQVEQNKRESIQQSRAQRDAVKVYKHEVAQAKARAKRRGR